jgi:hypothetical protein
MAIQVFCVNSSSSDPSKTAFPDCSNDFNNIEANDHIVNSSQEKN